MGVDTIASYSGQFVVHGSTMPVPRFLEPQVKADYVEVTPQLAAVTAERVKYALLDELNLTDAYQQKVHLIVMPLARPENRITIVSRLYTDGVVFQMGLPGWMEHTRLIQALSQVLLSDVATRGSPGSAEIPAWLSEGMAQRVQARVASTIVANRVLMTYEVSGYDRLRVAREVLGTNSCLTFHQLSFPESEMSKEEARIYESSAHLFLAELLRLRGGPELLTRFLRTLPHTRNWQTAFYRVYQAHFQTALDVEKWWALSWFDLKSKEEQQTWPLGLSLQKLNNVLLTTMEVRESADRLPERREVPLQRVIEHSDWAAQSEVLSEKVRRMFFLQFNMPPETQQVLAEYRKTIGDYLERRTLIGDSDRLVERLVRSTREELNQLDLKRESLRLMAGPP